MVLAGIGLTVALVVLAEAGRYVRNQGMTQFAGEVLSRASAAVTAYRANFGVYPPDRLSRWQGANPGPTHRPQTEGAACLFQAVAATGGAESWSGAAGPMNRAVGDTDGDGLQEIIDGWGRPLLYYDGYGAERKVKLNQRPGELPAFRGTSESRMRALNKSLAERWIHSDRPLIDSAGPDGEFNTSDDLRCDEDTSVSPPGE